MFQSLTPHEQQRGGGGVDDGGAGRAVETAVTGAIRGTEQPVDGGGQSPSDYNYPSPRHTSPSSFHQVRAYANSKEMSMSNKP